MWSRFRQRGKSITLDNPGPTANAKATSPTPQLSLDGSEEEEEDDEVRNKYKLYTGIFQGGKKTLCSPGNDFAPLEMILPPLS